MNGLKSNTPNTHQAFDRNVDELKHVFQYLNAFFDQHGIDKRLRFQTQLAVEEVFINMVRHNASGTEQIAVNLSISDDKMTVRVVDKDAEPYDITQHPDPDTSAPIEERQIGGLGIHLAKRLVDEIGYDHFNQQSTITLVQNLKT